MAISSGRAKPEREAVSSLIPSPAPLRLTRLLWHAAALPPPFHRHHRPPLLAAAAAAQPALQVENLRRGDQPRPQQRLRRQQSDVLAGAAIHLDEIARREILDARGVEREHSGSPKFLERSMRPARKAAVNRRRKRRWMRSLDRLLEAPMAAA